jgi:hypothetical protein
VTDSLGPSIAAYGLPGTVACLPDEPLRAGEWHSVLQEAKHTRMLGLLSQAIADGSFATTDQQAEEAYDAHGEAMGLVLMLERVLLEVVGLLTDAALDHRVLKGSAAAHLDYPDPSLRPFGDIDVLVPTACFDDAVAALLAYGYTRGRPQLRPDFDRRFAKSVTLATPDRLPVDLHRTLAPGRFGLMLAMDDLFASSSPLVLGGRPLKALGDEERFLHACYHAALGSSAPPLLALRDIVQMLLTTELDLGLVQRRCQAWRGQAVLARAVVLTADTLGLVDGLPLARWARCYRPDAVERWVLRAYTVHRSSGAQAVTSLAAIPGLHDKVAFLWALAVPGRTFLGDAPGRYWRWWTRGAATLARVARRG